MADTLSTSTESTTISGLPTVSDPATELAGAVMEWELLLSDGSRRNVQVSFEQLASVLGSAGTSTTTPATKLATPQNLRVVGTPTASSIQVAWDGVAYNSGYTLQRALVTNGVPGAYASLPVGSGTSYTDSGRTGGATYSYRIRTLGTGSYSNSDYSDALSVTAGAAANQPPSVTINGPNSATVGTNQNYQSVASDSDGTIALVELLLMADANTLTSFSVIGSDSSSPYVIGWTPQAAGTNYLRMRATDDKGAQSFSSVLAVSVTATSTSAKKVALLYVGDSKVRGYEASDQVSKCFPAQLYGLLDPARFAYQDAWNFAISGSFIAPNSTTSANTTRGTQIPQAAQAIQGLDPAVYGLAIVTIGGLHNDFMYGMSAADAATAMQGAIADVLAIQAGVSIRVNIQTVDPNGKAYGTTSLADYETRRVAYNQQALANFQAWGAFNLTNYGADSRKNNVNDTTYYNADKQHETDAGYLADAQDHQPNVVATANGQHLTPPATISSTSNNSSTTGSGYTPSNLTSAPLTYSSTYFQTRVSNATATLTSTANANSVGYSAGIRSKLGIGPSSATVRGWVEFDLYASEVEFVAGLYSANGEPASVYAYDQISFAFNLQVDSNANGVRPFGVGTGSTAGTTANFTSFADGTTVRIAVEQARVAWYVNGKEVLAVAVNDASTYYFQVAFKGAGANIRNVRLAADNLVDSGRPAYAAPATSTATPSAGYASWFKSDTNVTAGASSFSWGDAASSDVASTSNAGGVQVLQSALNGFPAVRLTSTALDGTSNTGPAGTSPFQFLLVGRLPSGGSDNNFNLMGYGLTCPPGNNSVDYRGKMVDMLAFNQKLCLHTNGNYGSGTPPVPGENSGYSPPAVSYDQFAIYGIRWDGTNGESDNSLVGASTPGAIYRDANAPTSPIRIGGGHFDVSPADFNVGTLDVCEIITRNTYSQSAWDADISYLKARYGF